MNEERINEARSDKGRRGFLAKTAALLGALSLMVAGAFLTFAGPAEARRWMERHPPCAHEHGRISEHARWAADRMLDRVDATEAQRVAILEIVDRTAAELESTHDGHGQLRDALVTELTAPAVDRATLEKLRAEKIVALDDASQRVVAALAEIADTLDAEQRMQIAKHVSGWRR